MIRQFFSLTRFDLTVLTAALILIAAIAVTAAVGIADIPVRVAYLKLSETNGYYDVWLADPDNPKAAKQVTFSENGVFDYDVSRDGRYIAYSEIDFDTGIGDIYLLDVQSKSLRQMTNCVMQDSSCSAPAFRPDSHVIAYERIEFNSGINAGVGSSRIWLMDLTSQPVSTFPLFDDSQILGYGARWSANGSRLAFYDSINQGILVYNFEANEVEGEQPLQYVQTQYGEVGSLSPDGSRMVFPEMMLDEQQTRSYLQIADLETGLFRPIVEPDITTDDQQPVWSPDGRYIAIGRRFWDEERFTRGAQVYLLDLQTNESIPLVVDGRFSSALFAWDNAGQRLAMQRFQQLGDDGEFLSNSKTEVWTYDLQTRRLTKIDEDARNPIWVAKPE